MISIIIPTFYEEKVIESTLLLTSTLTLLHEVIVSDGGSSDRTVEPVPQELRKPAIWLVPHPAARQDDLADRLPFFAECPVADCEKDHVEQPHRDQLRVADPMAASAAVQHTKFWSDHRSADPGKTAKHVGVLERDQICTKPAQASERLPPDHLKFAEGSTSFQQVIGDPQSKVGDARDELVTNRLLRRKHAQVGSQSDQPWVSLKIGKRLCEEPVRLWDNAGGIKKDEKIACGSLGAVVTPFANCLTACARIYDDGVRMPGGQFGCPIGTAPVRDDHLVRQGECRCQCSQSRFDNLRLVQGWDDDRNHAALVIVKGNYRPITPPGGPRRFRRGGRRY